jgi:flagellar basal body-associated protein FliL
MNSKTNSDRVGLIWALIASLLIWAAVAVMTSCTLRVNEDGSKDATLDAPAALRVLEIIAEK